MSFGRFALGGMVALVFLKFDQPRFHVSLVRKHANGAVGKPVVLGLPPSSKCPYSRPQRGRRNLFDA